MGKFFYTILLFLVMLTLNGFINSPAGAAQEHPRVFLDGQLMTFDVPPVIVEGRTLVPLRAVFQSLGANVTWDEDTKTVTAARGVTLIKLQIDNKTAFKNNQPVYLEVPPTIMNDRTLVPLRFVSEALEARVDWDGPSQTVTITSKYKDSGALSKGEAGSVSSYMIYYGYVDGNIIALAKTYDLVILHTGQANLTRRQVEEIQKGVDPLSPADDVLVLGYISIGEDLRTVGLSAEQMKADPRFTGDGTGPRVDPRGPHPNGGAPLPENDLLGDPSPSGSGFASWYLDDNNMDGKPDTNAFFKAAFVNAGDPAWFEVVNNMTKDGADHISGLAELLTTGYGRGLGLDGVFLDTVDTCAPNYYTDQNSPNQSEFEWTTPGFVEFIKKVRDTYPNKLVLQNRGLFFFDPRQEHYKYTTRPYIDLVLFESYRLNSNNFEEYSETFFPDNKYNYAPKLMAEANRADGFEVLSLGYAEGPPDKMSTDTLLGSSSLGYDSLIEDIEEAQSAGFRHYITNAGIDLANTFVMDHADLTDSSPPEWSSTYNANAWPPGKPSPRTGIQEAAAGRGCATVRWDVALDSNRVGYALYYQTEPFDFRNDPKLTTAKRIVLDPAVGDGYAGGVGPGIYPYQAIIKDLTPGQTYYFNIRAFDDSPAANEDSNQVCLSCRVK
ncbi:MAG: hypothetical protein A4E55_01251 [Pelotomaculum sp. PtaU1.Bin035]|nr:MAG: hypothetical protein A4E55_01251 [Pelotomaculum sp. PtaU1.Bin035]